MSIDVDARRARFLLGQLEHLERSRVLYFEGTPERVRLERRIDAARDLCMMAEKPLNDAGWHLSREGVLGRIVPVAA